MTPDRARPWSAPPRRCGRNGPPRWSSPPAGAPPAPQPGAHRYASGPAGSGSAPRRSCDGGLPWPDRRPRRDARRRRQRLQSRERRTPRRPPALGSSRFARSQTAVHPPSLGYPSCLHPALSLALRLPPRRNRLAALVAAGPRRLQRASVRRFGDPGRCHAGDLDKWLVTGLGQGYRARAGAGPRPAGGHATSPAAAPAVDEQPVDRVGHRVERGLDHGQGPEGLPLGIRTELDLEHHAPPVLVPFPVGRAVGQRRLDQGAAVGVLPSPCGELAVENLDRPPCGHTPTIGANAAKSTLAARFCPGAGPAAPRLL